MTHKTTAFKLVIWTTIAVALGTITWSSTAKRSPSIDQARAKQAVATSPEIAELPNPRFRAFAYWFQEWIEVKGEQKPSCSRAFSCGRIAFAFRLREVLRTVWTKGTDECEDRSSCSGHRIMSGPDQRRAPSSHTLHANLKRSTP